MFILYTKTGCPWCTEATDYLERHGYAYEERDARVDPRYLEELKNVSGQSKAPTLVSGDLVLADFDTGELEAFLREHQLRP